MKKIILALIIVLFISCSKNNDNLINPLNEKLKGKWTNNGYYTDLANPDTPDGFYPDPDGVIIIYSNETFSSTLNGNPYKSGTYNVSIDSALFHNNEEVGKIYQLDNSRLIIYNLTLHGSLSYTKN